MTQFIAVDETGRVDHTCGRADPPDFVGPPAEAPAPRDGLTFHSCQERIDFGAAPAAGFVLKFDGVLVWDDQRPIEQARMQAVDRIKAARDAAENAPFDCAGGTYDGDEKATVRISGATIGAMMATLTGAPFSKVFTLADNSSVTLSGAEMMAVGATLIARVGAMFDTGRALRAAIDAVEPGPTANTQLDAINWPSQEP